mgnify:CR=1 FL=1
MSTLFITHPVCYDHSNFPGHPEQPDRLKAISGALEDPAFFMLIRMDAPLGEIKDIKRVHPPYYIDSILENVPKEGFHQLDPDTGMCPASGEAALRAVGAGCAAVDAVMRNEARNAFCAVRPPGHHAEATQAMGFCLFSNIAIAAKHALHDFGLDRVAVVDFDVHHGNGTQSAFEEDPRCFYASSHQWPAFPGTGMEHETGVANNIVNVPLAPGSGSAEFREAYTGRILPRLRAFDPDLLLVSAGFDAHASDPLAQLRLQTADFAWITDELQKVARDCCNNRLVSMLEGGYDLPALGACVTAHMRELMGI